MHAYARGMAGLLLGGFGFVAILVGLDGVFGPIGAPGQDAAAKAMAAEHVPAIGVLVLGILAVVVASWLLRGFKAARDEGDRL